MTGSPIASAEMWIDPSRLKNCRLLVVWPDDPDLMVECIGMNKFLRRVVVVMGPGDVPVRYGDARIRLMPVKEGGDIAAALKLVLKNDFACVAEGKVSVVLDPGRRRRHPELCSAIEAGVMSHVRATLSFVALRATRGWHMLMNILLNLPRAAGESTINALRARCAGQPAIIVGAGPSLDQSVADLARYHAKAVVIACDGAWSTLALAGIVPDIVVAVDDSERIWRHCAGLGDGQADVPVACLLQTAWPVARYHRGPIYWGGSGKCADRIISREVREFPVFDTGQCVGHAALEVASIIGADRIIMVGFDLSFAGKRGHPEHHAVPYYDDDPPPPDQQTVVQGNDGAYRASDWTLKMYHREFERRIALLNVPVVNATVSGARIAGTTVMDLCSAVSSLPDLQKQAFSDNNTGQEAFLRSGMLGEKLRQVFMDLSETIKSAIAAKTAPAHSGTDPLPFLEPFRSIVDVLTEIEHPSAILEFCLAWEDWIGNGAPADDEGRHVARLAERTMETLGRDGELFGALPGLEGGDLAGRFAARQVLAIAGTDQPGQEWRQFVDQWTAAGWSVHFWPGRTDDAAGIWKYINRNTISVLLSTEGSVFPAIWAVPFCGCVELKLKPPSGPPVREAWLPGYVAMAIDPVVAAAWRITAPADRPVIYCNCCGTEPASGRAICLAAGFMEQELTSLTWHHHC
ncbi:MAG: 6-hydroxymethylpterin diphosphokinase MptE-like protein [bacterium]